MGNVIDKYIEKKYTYYVEDPCEYKHVEFSQLKGEVIKECKVVRNIPYKLDSIYFLTEHSLYELVHIQDCCEDVTIDDINGDLDCLLNTPITLAEESTNSNDTQYGSETWTFYKLGSVKGYVDIRWYGSSNGYYSERVDLIKFNLYDA